MIACWILIGRQLVEARSVTEWAEWFETGDRIVEQTTLADGRWVSTVCLGMDHRFAGKGPPLVFETMVFGEKRESVECHRTATWDDAQVVHNATVKRLTVGEADPVDYE